MYIWDINPGYLNNEILFIEHDEIQKLFSIIFNNKKECQNGPVVRRWSKYLDALSIRHSLIISEIKLRGFSPNSSLKLDNKKNIWPLEYIHEPRQQFDILFSKYKNKNSGRIPLPISSQNLWSQHKYSVMARNLNEYKKIGRYLSNIKANQCFSSLSKDLTELLREKPDFGGIRNSLHHMWGYFKNYNFNVDVDSLDLDSLLSHIQICAYKKKDLYILGSTALSELRVWI